MHIKLFYLSICDWMDRRERNGKKIVIDSRKKKKILFSRKILQHLSVSELNLLSLYLL
jgi:hypothetical protein